MNYSITFNLSEIFVLEGYLRFEDQQMNLTTQFTNLYPQFKLGNDGLSCRAKQVKYKGYWFESTWAKNLTRFLKILI